MTKYFYGCVVLIAAASALTGCADLPKDGPLASEVRDAAEIRLADTAARLSYVVADINPLSLSIVNQATQARQPRFGHMPGGTGGQSGRDVRIQVGDITSVTIFEAQAGGLFIPSDAGSRSGNFVQVPNQQVDESGKISVPYAGQIQVAGRTASEVQQEIVNRLKNRAIDPQAVVSIVERRSSDVSIFGDVNSPARFSLDPGGLKVLGAIARVGGSRFPAYETVVTLQRGGVTQSASLSALIKDPSQNIRVLPGDVVFLGHDPKVFMVLGATPSPGSIGGTNNRRFTFDNDNESLAEGVAKAGGLDSLRADTRSVFVFRPEQRAVLARAGVDISHYEGDLIPTIYRLDLSRADGLFLANNFYLRDKDIIYVSDALLVDVAKVFGLVSAITSPATGVAATAIDVR